LLNPWIVFIFSAALIIWAGTTLTKNADLISEKTGLGAAWAGALLLPLATSLPEVVTSWRSAVIGAPDLALGNVFGSNMFNVAIIALVDLISPGPPVLRQVKTGHILTAGLSIAVTSFVALAIILPPSLTFLGVGLEGWFILFFYLSGSRLLMRYERRFPVLKTDLPSSHLKDKTLTQGILGFILAGGVIVFAGSQLADAGKVIAQETGLGETLVGSLLIAVITSLPELATTLTAARLGLFDMAIGNIFGANFLNLFIIFLSDLFYQPGPILKNVSFNHLLNSQVSIFLMSLAVISLIYRSRKTVVGLGLDSLAIIITYLAAFVLLFTLGASS